MSKINFAKLRVQVSEAESRTPITSEKVKRPVQAIVAEIHKSVRESIWQQALQTITEMHGKPVDAKGASWLVNDDEAARAIRVNYNLIQPDYFENGRKTQKMTKEQSQDLWTQIAAMMEKPEPVFSTDDDDSDE